MSCQARSRFAQSGGTTGVQWMRILLPLADSNSIRHSGAEAGAGAISSTNLGWRVARVPGRRRPRGAVQFAGIQVQLLGSPVHAFSAGGLDSGRPQLIRDRRFPCTSAPPFLELRRTASMPLLPLRPSFPSSSRPTSRSMTVAAAVRSFHTTLPKGHAAFKSRHRVRFVAPGCELIDSMDAVRR